MTRVSTQILEGSLDAQLRVSRFIIAYKFTLGLIEFLSGIALLLWGGSAFRLAQTLLLRRLSEDPQGVLAHLSARIVPSLFAHHSGLVVYLIVLGLAKTAGAVGLLYQKHWGVDLLVGLSMVMLPFQLINLLHHPSPLNAAYLLMSLLITLYLIHFKPLAWVARMSSLAKSLLKGMQA